MDTDFVKLLAQYLMLAQQNVANNGDAGRMSTGGGAAMRQAPVGPGGNNDYLRGYRGGPIDNAPGIGTGAYGIGGVGDSQLSQAPVGLNGNNDYMRSYRGPGGFDFPPAGTGAYGMGDAAKEMLRVLMALQGR